MGGNQPCRAGKIYLTFKPLFKKKGARKINGGSKGQNIICFRKVPYENPTEKLYKIGIYVPSSALFKKEPQIIEIRSNKQSLLPFVKWTVGKTLLSSPRPLQRG